MMMSGQNEIDSVSGVETTGHSWDGIKELNNPLPRWWLWTFYACIAFALVYSILYPAWPGITGASKGIWSWSSRADIRNELDVAEQAKASQITLIKSHDINAILADEKLRGFAVVAGASIFKTRCATCHGSGAQGSPGFPNLNDNTWLWGGKPEQILQTIAHGIRDSSDPKTRTSMMPAFGKDNILKPEEISAVANYVRQISKQEADAKLAEAGAIVFKNNCGDCHGEAGVGKIEFGAPRLNDAIWHYSGDLAAIKNQIDNPRHGVMPAWGAKLGDVSVKEVAAYVHSLGGGE
jgi:cytochrome c oxidase cbb3-type subunit III